MTGRTRHAKGRGGRLETNNKPRGALASGDITRRGQGQNQPSVPSKLPDVCKVPCALEEERQKLDFRLWMDGWVDGWLDGPANERTND